MLRCSSHSVVLSIWTVWNLERPLLHWLREPLTQLPHHNGRTAHLHGTLLIWEISTWIIHFLQCGKPSPIMEVYTTSFWWYWQWFLVGFTTLVFSWFLSILFVPRSALTAVWGPWDSIQWRQFDSQHSDWTQDEVGLGQNLGPRRFWLLLQGSNHISNVLVSNFESTSMSIIEYPSLCDHPSVSYCQFNSICHATLGNGVPSSKPWTSRLQRRISGWFMSTFLWVHNLVTAILQHDGLTLPCYWWKFS
jgi:hypothetical protein